MAAAAWLACLGAGVALITAGAPAPLAAQTQSTREVLAAIDRHLQGPARENQRFQRYFTLTNLTDEDEKLGRAALSKLVNSLSWKREIHKPELVGKAVLAIDLRKLGWNSGDLWQKVLDRYPYGLKHDRFPRDETTQQLARKVVEQTGTGVPFVRADWFIATASRPPLYHTLLRIPKTAAELEERLGVDVETNFLDNNLFRAGFTFSGVSSQNRLIERHASQYGAYWRSYDFREGGERADLFRYPLGPVFQGHPFPDFAFEQAGGEIIFHLPNGLQGYMVVNAQGGRIKEAPTDVVSDDSSGRAATGTSAIVTGLSCMRCHANGLMPLSDRMRERTVVRGDALIKVNGLHPLPNALIGIMDDDNTMFRCALEKAIESVPRVRGMEPADIAGPTPIAQRYRGVLRPDTAAAELGLNSGQEFADAIRSNPLLHGLGLESLLGDGGNIERENWEAVFGQTAQGLASGEPVVVPSGPLAPGSTARIVSPGVDQVEIQASCQSTRGRFVSVGKTVRVTEECPRGDLFCIRAEDGSNLDLGCAARDQLEPIGPAN